MARRPLRVLAVIPDLNIGGGENRVLNMARALDRSSCEYTVATLYAPHPELEQSSGSMHEVFRDSGVQTISLDLPRPERRSGIRAVQLAATAVTLASATYLLRRRLRAGTVDLLDAHLDGTLCVAVPAARAAGVPVAVTLYSALSVTNERQTLIRRIALWYASALFTDSDATALALRGFAGPRCPPVFVVPNGVSLPAPSRTRDEVLASLGIPSSAEAVVGQVSGLVPYKGHLTLLQAARTVLEQRPETYFLLVGFPRTGVEYVRSLEAEAVRLGIADRVKIRSYPGSIADVWQVIDIHAHASAVDSLPNAIIEGMSLGKPAVVTSVGGIPDLVEHQQTGLVVSAGDAPALAACLLALLRSAGLREQLGAAARHRYSRHYTPEITAGRTQRHFDTIHAAHVRARAGGAATPFRD